MYDSALIDRTSDYTKSAYVLLTYNNNGYYLIKNTGSDGFRDMHLTDGLFDTPCEISVDMNFPSLATWNNQIMVGLLNSQNNGFGVRFIKTTTPQDNVIVLEQLTGSNTWTNINNSVSMSSVQVNVWYHYVIRIESDKLTGSIYDMNDNLIATRTDSITATSNGKLQIVKGYASNSEVYLRNIKIKPL